MPSYVRGVTLSRWFLFIKHSFRFSKFVFCKLQVLPNWHLIVDNSAMNIYKGYRFPADIISYAVWVYYRFNLSYRDAEDLLAERGVNVSYESIRLWCDKFGLQYAKRLKRKHQCYGDTFFTDEIFLKINGTLLRKYGSQRR